MNIQNTRFLMLFVLTLGLTNSEIIQSDEYEYQKPYDTAGQEPRSIPKSWFNRAKEYRDQIIENAKNHIKNLKEKITNRLKTPESPESLKQKYADPYRLTKTEIEQESTQPVTTKAADWTDEYGYPSANTDTTENKSKSSSSDDSKNFFKVGRIHRAIRRISFAELFKSDEQDLKEFLFDDINSSNKNDSQTIVKNELSKLSRLERGKLLRDTYLLLLKENPNYSSTEFKDIIDSVLPDNEKIQIDTFNSNNKFLFRLVDKSTDTTDSLKNLPLKEGLKEYLTDSTKFNETAIKSLKRELTNLSASARSKLLTETAHELIEKQNNKPGTKQAFEDYLTKFSKILPRTDILMVTHNGKETHVGKANGTIASYKFVIADMKKFEYNTNETIEQNAKQLNKEQSLNLRINDIKDRNIGLKSSIEEYLKNNPSLTSIKALLVDNIANAPRTDKSTLKFLSELTNKTLAKIFEISPKMKELFKNLTANQLTELTQTEIQQFPKMKTDIEALRTVFKNNAQTYQKFLKDNELLVPIEDKTLNNMKSFQFEKIDISPIKDKFEKISFSDQNDLSNEFIKLATELSKESTYQLNISDMATELETYWLNKMPLSNLETIAPKLLKETKIDSIKEEFLPKSESKEDLITAILENSSNLSQPAPPIHEPSKVTPFENKRRSSNDAPQNNHIQHLTKNSPEQKQLVTTNNHLKSHVGSPREKLIDPSNIIDKPSRRSLPDTKSADRDQEPQSIDHNPIAYDPYNPYYKSIEESIDNEITSNSEFINDLRKSIQNKLPDCFDRTSESEHWSNSSLSILKEDLENSIINKMIKIAKDSNTKWNTLSQDDQYYMIKHLYNDLFDRIIKLEKTVYQDHFFEALENENNKYTEDIAKQQKIFNEAVEYYDGLNNQLAVEAKKNTNTQNSLVGNFQLSEDTDENNIQKKQILLTQIAEPEFPQLYSHLNPSMENSSLTTDINSLTENNFNTLMPQILYKYDPVRWSRFDHASQTEIVQELHKFPKYQQLPDNNYEQEKKMFSEHNKKLKYLYKKYDVE